MADRSHLKVYQQLAKLRQDPAFTHNSVQFIDISDVGGNDKTILSYIRAQKNSDKYLVVMNFGHQYANDVDLSKGAGSEKGTVVVNAMSAYRKNETIALKSVTLSRGQGLVIKVMWGGDN